MPTLFGAIPGNETRAYYGTMFQIAKTDVVTIAESGVYQDIIGFSAGTTLGWTFQNGMELICVKPGTYLILWSVVVKCLDNNKELRITLKNATIDFPTTRGIRDMDKDDIVTLNGFGVGPASVGNTARLGITSVPAGDFIIVDAKLTLIRLDS